MLGIFKTKPSPSKSELEMRQIVNDRNAEIVMLRHELDRVRRGADRKIKELLQAVKIMDHAIMAEANKRAELEVYQDAAQTEIERLRAPVNPVASFMPDPSNGKYSVRYFEVLIPIGEPTKDGYQRTTPGAVFATEDQAKAQMDALKRLGYPVHYRAGEGRLEFLREPCALCGELIRYEPNRELSTELCGRLYHDRCLRKLDVAIIHAKAKEGSQ